MKNKQKNMEELLKAELKREADEIIAEVNADESLQNIKLPEDMDDKLFEMIRKHEAQKAAYEMLSDKDKEALRIGRELQFLGEDVVCPGNAGGEDETDENEADENGAVGSAVPVSAGAKSVSDEKVVRFTKKKKKMYLIVAAVAIMTLAAGMTSIGGAPFISKIKKQIIGEREMVQIDAERQGEESVQLHGNREEEAYQDIDESFGINTVKIDYKPVGMEFVKYSVDERLGKAYLLYKRDDSLLEYKLVVSYGEQSLGYDVEDAAEEKETIHVNGVDVKVKEHQLQEGKIEYVAQFKYKDVNYVMNSSLKEEELQEIIKNLKFF